MKQAGLAAPLQLVSRERPALRPDEVLFPGGLQDHLAQAEFALRQLGQPILRAFKKFDHQNGTAGARVEIQQIAHGLKFTFAAGLVE